MPEPSPFPLAELLGLTMSVDETGAASATVQTDKWQHNPHGAVHGGVFFTMLDTCMGAATKSVLRPGEACASVEVHLRFVQPMHHGVARARASVVHRGRRIIQLEGRVHDEDDNLIATATGSFAVVPSLA